MDRRADYPTSHKTNRVTKLNQQPRNVDGLLGSRPGTSNGKGYNTVNEYKFQQVLDFTYLDSSLNGNNEIEINIRIMMGNRANFSHLNLFKFNILSKRTKMKLYETLTQMERIKCLGENIHLQK